MNYEKLSYETQQKISKTSCYNLSCYAFCDDNYLRRNPDFDKSTVIRPPFVRDIDKIIHCPYFNRYSDKTQVFSLYKNDDISRRALHVQLVSRIARTIGRSLKLNQELIEAIALGHDIGHTPFAHSGEKYLDELFFKSAGRHFNHNIQSVRVLDSIFPYNITLQTLDGIACHNGELELDEYRPVNSKTFEEFDKEIESCYLDSKNILKLVPSTLEACVVRISDIIAYLGKDRQDAERAMNRPDDKYSDNSLGKYNAEIINNLITNIIENSYDKPYIKMDKEHFDALKQIKADNYELIYFNDVAKADMDEIIKPMMSEIFYTLLDDLKANKKESPIFAHHIDYINKAHYTRIVPYEKAMPEQIVVDYIASMTDDYFIELHQYLFPNSNYSINYKSYFNPSL